MNSPTFLVGTPPPVLMPARSHKLQYAGEVYMVTVPIKGESYDICPEEGVFLFGTLVETLFALGKYPDLQDNQIFVILGVETEGEDISLVGRVTNILED